MLAVSFGYISIVLGLFILALPVLIIQLSRPKDSLLGAMVMVLGLILTTSNERFNGSPMLALILGSIILSRLLLEVSYNRWNQLSLEEKSSLKKISHWESSFKEFVSVFLKLGSIFVEVFNLFKPKAKPSSKAKKWVSPKLKEEKLSSQKKQTVSSEAKIKNKNLVSDEISSLKSENNPSDSL